MNNSGQNPMTQNFHMAEFEEPETSRAKDKLPQTDVEREREREQVLDLI